MSFPLSTFGMNPDDIRYLHCDSYVQGKGRDRLKYLDLEGRWILSGRSIPFISATFNHIEKLNYAQGAIFDITEPALDAIGLIGWTPEQRPKEEKKKPFVLKRPPVVEVVEEVQSPREPVPHRSAGYGPAHHKRKLSVPDRSRSPSASSRDGSPVPPEFDKYATRYQRKESITSYGTKWGNRDDLGYGSAVSSGAPSPNTPHREDNHERYPHRTQAISPLPNPRSVYDSDYDPSYLKKVFHSFTASESGNTHYDTMEIKSRANRASYRPQYYNVKSGQNDYSSGSEQASPNKRNQTAEEYLLESYHKKTTGSRYLPTNNY
jgi:hypothetical protein